MNSNEEKELEELYEKIKKNVEANCDKGEDMFKTNYTKPITEEEFIGNVVNDIIDNLDDDEKQNWIDNPEYDHFGRGMWIRNTYLWGQNLPFMLFPDDLSSVIFEKVIEELKR